MFTLSYSQTVRQGKICNVNKSPHAACTSVERNVPAGLPGVNNKQQSLSQSVSQSTLKRRTHLQQRCYIQDGHRGSDKPHHNNVGIASRTSKKNPAQNRK